LIRSRMLIQANSGAGKSWTIRRLLEQTFGLAQHIVLDCEGEFFTLRERFDYVLAGRDGGDCPAEPRGAALLARKLLELRVSAIIDIQELKAHEQYAFVQAFLESLIGAKRSLWHPALIVVDEAHKFAPERGKAASLGAVIDLMTRGRKRGYCGVLATQRLSKLHKDAAAEANNKLIGRTSLDVDMKRAADELGFSGKEEQRSLRTLERGVFYAFGPAISDEVVEVKVGPVQTTHPEPGARSLPPPPARDAVKRVLGELADLPQQAQAEARTIAEATARVKSLEREIRTLKRSAPPASEEELAKAREAGARDAEAKLRDLVARISVRDGQIGRWVGSVQTDAQKILDALGPIEVDLEPAKAARRIERPAARVRKPVARSEPDDAEIDGPMQKILDSLAWLASIDITEPEKVQVAAVAGYAAKGGGFRNPLSRLKTAGLIEYGAGDSARLTPAGEASANYPEESPTTEELHARVLETVKGGTHKRILRVILDGYPDALDTASVAEAVSMEASGGGFRNPVSKLKTLGLIEYPQRGYVRARDVLFI